MSFRSIDHSSPVTVTLSNEQTKQLLDHASSQTPRLVESSYDDSFLRATIAHLQGEVSWLHSALKECKERLDNQPAPLTPDYGWITEHINEFKDILKTLAINKEIPTNLWDENISRALSDALSTHEKPSSIAFPESLPHDPILRVSSLLSSLALVTISILLMLQYIYN